MKKTLFAAAFVALAALAGCEKSADADATPATQGDVAAQTGENADAIAKLNDRVERLESRVDDLESENAALKSRAGEQ